MNRPLVVNCAAEPGLRLRAADAADIEALRVWKNANKSVFFFKDEITVEMQKKWFEAYQRRPKDFMFLVEKDGKKIGCMAFRILDDGSADVYNVIAAPGAAGQGLMKAALAAMCSYAADGFTKDVGCLVLKDNPAVGFYEACGFKIAGDGGGHHVLKLDWTRFKSAGYDAEEG